MKNIELSLILPCYNEAEHFGESAEIILQTLHQSKLRYEIIFVEDKSTDETKKLLKEFIRKNKSEPIQLVCHDENQGRGKSVSDGIYCARGKYVGFIDIDCEVSPKYIPKCFKMLKEGYDVVCASRSYETYPSGFIRAVASNIYKSIMQMVLNTTLPDTEAGYKFFDRLEIIKLLPKVKNKHWFWDTEIMIRSEKKGLKIQMIPVLFQRRKDKTSTVLLLPDSLSYLKNLFLFRYTLQKEGLI